MSDLALWQIIIPPRAEKELKGVPARDQFRIRDTVDDLSTGFPHGDLKKLKGKEQEWRLRVGDWRVRLRADFKAHTIVILRVLHRSSAYRD